MPLEQLHRPSELDEVRRGRDAHRLLGDRPLEHASRAQDVDRRRLLELDRGEDRDRRDEVGDDEDPAGLATADLDKAGELEDAKRLAERRLRDAEALCEHALVRELVAGAQPGLLDRLREVLDRRLEGPCRADGLDLECGVNRHDAWSFAGSR